MKLAIHALSQILRITFHYAPKTQLLKLIFIQIYFRDFVSTQKEPDTKGYNHGFRRLNVNKTNIPANNLFINMYL